MKWEIKRDSTGWPWIESATHTIAKYGRERSDYLLFRKRVNKTAQVVRVVTAEEVVQALQGEWTP